MRPPKLAEVRAGCNEQFHAGDIYLGTYSRRMYVAELDPADLSGLAGYFALRSINHGMSLVTISLFIPNEIPEP
jgi:hypothetical protein